MSELVITLAIEDARELCDELQETAARLDRLIVSGGRPDPNRHSRVKRLAEVLATRIARHERGER